MAVLDEELLVRIGIPIARSLVSQCLGQGVDADDLESAAMLALTYAIRSFHPTTRDHRGRWRSWVRLAVMRALVKLVRDAPLAHFADIPPEIRDQAQRCQKAMACLAARGIRRPTWEQIAEESLLSVETVLLLKFVPGIIHRQSLIDWCDSRSGESGLLDPESEPMFPCASYTPQSACPHHGPIPKGSILYCVVCHRYGCPEHPALRRDRRDDPAPERKPESPPTPASKPKRETRKVKRRRIFGPLVEKPPEDPSVETSA